MARNSWFDDKAEHSTIQEQVGKLESFTSALADGVVSRQELGAQEQRLVAALMALVVDVSVEELGKGTSVLLELTAYNVMRLLHELQAQRAKIAFSNA